MNSIDLSCSIHELQQSPLAQERVGQHICSRMEILLGGAIALKKFAEVANDHGNRGICAGITLATGISCLAQGHFVTGSIATFAGLKEVVNIYQTVNSKNDIASLLNDANAGVDMVKTLEEANGESFKVVDTNLGIIRKNVKKMNDRMEKIKAIVTEGQKDIEELKAQASESYEEAEEQFCIAKDSFNLSQKRFANANKIFMRALKQFDELFKLVQTAEITDSEKLEKFIKIAKRIQEQCLAAQKVIKQGNEQMDIGLQALECAQDKEHNAYGQSILAIERAKNKLELIEAQAKVKREYEQKIDDTKEELDHIQARNKDITILLNELSTDLKDGKKLSDDKFGTLSVALGVIPGAVVGFSVGGWVGAMAGGLGGGAAIHHRNAILNKVDDFVNGSVILIDTNPNKKECVKVKFNSRSTGWWNRFIKGSTQSHTAGMVEIQVGKEAISLPFNLNKDYKINKPDLYEFQQLLGKKVINGEITAQECLNIISELESKSIDRGLSKKAEKGLITSNSLYFNELKRVCEKIVEREQKTVDDIVEAMAIAG